MMGCIGCRTDGSGQVQDSVMGLVPISSDELALHIPAHTGACKARTIASCCRRQRRACHRYSWYSDHADSWFTSSVLDPTFYDYEPYLKSSVVTLKAPGVLINTFYDPEPRNIDVLQTTLYGGSDSNGQVMRFFKLAAIAQISVPSHRKHLGLVFGFVFFCRVIFYGFCQWVQCCHLHISPQQLPIFGAAMEVQQLVLRRRRSSRTTQQQI